MLQIIDVCKSYGDKEVLKNISFNVNKGEICGLLGLNGAGKSTLMKIITSLVFETSGSILLNDNEIFQKPRCGNNDISFMIESPTFYKNLTGKQNLLALASLFPLINKDRIDTVLALTGLTHQSFIPVRKYSLGMKQRLYFAFAIMKEPKLLILDEPFNGVDPVTIKLFKDIIQFLKNNGCIILLSSHVISDIKNLCDKVVMIDKGLIVFDEYINQDTNLEEVFLSKVTADGMAQ